MHFIISIILGSLFLLLLARAIFETIFGLCQILIGLALYGLSYFLKGLAWCLRVYSTLWRTAIG